MVQTAPIPTDQFFKTAIADLHLSNERSALLSKIAAVICSEIKNEKAVNLNFICTHNSRRSQFAQVWANFATSYFDLPQINSYSGGTAITSFFRNTVKALQQTGFTFKLFEFSHRNPKYHISFDSSNHSIIGYSKRYDDPHNKSPFIAITTCDSADENCPFIPEAAYRFHLPFVDPKRYDNTPTEADEYLKTSKQIAGELYFLFEKIKNSL